MTELKPLAENTNALYTASLQKSSALVDPVNNSSSAFKTASSSSPEYTNTDLISPSLEIPLFGNNPNPNPYLTSAAIVPDFNADGKADKVWVDQTTGEVVVWLMDGTTVAAKGSLGQIDLSAWTYKIADFNSDGKTDFLLRNNQTGENRVLLMDGTKIASAVALENVDAAWSPLIGDFNGDRKTDIFWRNNTTGENAIWQMDGTAVVNATVIDSYDPTWTPNMVDFNGDGKTDIFWRSATGENSVWFIDGTQVTQSALDSQDPNWNYSFGDFNGDWKTDILWRNTTTGENTVWITNSVIPNNVFFTTGALTTLDSNWTYSIGDFNTDGKTDIFWHNNVTGANTSWLMDSTTITTETFLPPSSTTAKASFGDYNNDGRTDIYWRDYATGADEIWITNGDGTTVTKTPVADTDKLSPLVIGEDGNPVLGPDGQPIKKWVTI